MKQRAIKLKQIYFNFFERLVMSLIDKIPFTEHIYEITGFTNLINDIDKKAITETKLKEMMIMQPDIDFEITN